MENQYGPSVGALASNAMQPQQMGGKVGAKTQPQTVFDEIALRINSEVKRIYSMRMIFRSKIDRLIGSEPDGENTAAEAPIPGAPLDETFRALDELGFAVSGLENELARINKLVGE